MIHTDRLTLRAPTVADAPFIAEALSDFAVTKWLAQVPFPYQLEMAEEWLARDENSWPDLVVITREGAPIGVTDTKGGSIGYWLIQRAWGQGYMSEAAMAVRDAFFTRTTADHLGSGYFEGNAGSAGVLRKLGFSATQTVQMHNVAQDCVLPHVNMRLTRTEWEAAQ